MIINKNLIGKYQQIKRKIKIIFLSLSDYLKRKYLISHGTNSLFPINTIKLRNIILITRTR